MDIRNVTPWISTEMSVAAPAWAGRRNYPLRRLARAFGVLGVVGAVYALALLVIAVQSSIIEF